MAHLSSFKKSKMSSSAPQVAEQTPSSGNRFEELDGLRGIAALTVFFSHVYLMQKIDIIPSEVNSSVLRSLWDGDAAVFLFFILSGFVLALPYLTTSKRSIEYIPYIVRRIFRIYPAYIFALLFSLVLMHTVFIPENLTGLSPWIRSFWTTDVSLSEIGRHLSMIGPDTNKIDPPVWTLRLELIISCIYPMIIYVLKGKNSKFVRWAVIIGFFAFCLIKPSAFFYFGLFITGGIVAKVHMSAIQWLRKLSTVMGALCLALALCLYSSRFTIDLVGKNDIAWHILVGVGATLLIILAITYPPLTKLLKTRLIQFLGHVSYSFYLLHFPILLSVSSLVFPRIGSLWICAALSLICSLVVSHLVVRLIETPFQNLGKKVSKLPAITFLQKSVEAKVFPQ